MGIPSQQIGWSQKSKLLWQISNQLDKLIKVVGGGNIPATTTTTTTTLGPITTTTTTTAVPTTTTTTTTATPSYTIGEAALGGVIAYINGGGSTGTSGFVVTAADVLTSTPPNASWGCDGTLITGADGTAIGTGNQNTIDIMAGCSEAGIAARLCGDLTEGGYSDWYLPSKDELNALYLNRVAIGMPSANVYWSSTENDSSSAWSQFFGAGSQGSVGKSTSSRIRAIRSF
jgi:hypothetical protein